MNDQIFSCSMLELAAVSMEAESKGGLQVRNRHLK
jgi:hypothetical protein